MEAHYLTIALLPGSQMIILFSAITNAVTDILAAEILGSLSFNCTEGYEGCQVSQGQMALQEGRTNLYPQIGSFKRDLPMPMQCVACSSH